MRDCAGYTHRIMTGLTGLQKVYQFTRQPTVYMTIHFSTFAPTAFYN